jgi:hypothetical protein
LTANVTLLGLETEVNGHAEWQHPIEARNHLDPDGDDAELFNVSYIDNIVASIGDQSWALDVRYCFGLNLHLVLPHVFTAFLGSDNELSSLAQIHRTFGALQHIHLSHAEARPIARVSTPVEDEHNWAFMPPSRHTSMKATSHATSSTPVELEIHRPDSVGSRDLAIFAQRYTMEIL